MGASWPRSENQSFILSEEEEEVKERKTVTVFVLPQAESRRGKRLTGREIKKKTLADRRQPLSIDSIREDGLK